MRLWSIHPKHLDSKGLVALWRETLLAQAVLRGQTRGYKKHPQLERLRSQPSPLQAVNFYLWHVFQEAAARGYRFDARKIRNPRSIRKIPVQAGQIEYERRHLLKKLKTRDPARYRQAKISPFQLHPLFKRVAGGIESWERIT